MFGLFYVNTVNWISYTLNVQKSHNNIIDGITLQNYTILLNENATETNWCSAAI